MRISAIQKIGDTLAGEKDGNPRLGPEKFQNSSLSWFCEELDSACTQRGKNLGIIQAIEDVPGNDQAQAFHNVDEMLLSSTSVSIWVKIPACAV